MRVILSADDFGRSHQRNLAIDYAMRNGLIKSAALMVNSEHTDEAIRLANTGGYIENLHCHLSLAYGEAMSGNSKPLNAEFAQCSVFCENQEFRHPFYNKLDFWKYVDITYRELEAQYLRFRELTDGKGNLMHLDVHLYNNRSYPFAVAYRKLIENYGIKSARYFGVHHRTQRYPAKEEIRLFFSSLLCGKKALITKSCNVDYFLTKIDEFQLDNIVELYVHPDCVNGVLLDNTESVFGHTRKPLEEQVKALKASGEVELISWSELT